MLDNRACTVFCIDCSAL